MPEKKSTVQQLAKRIVNRLCSGHEQYEDVKIDARLRDEHWHYMAIYAARAGALSVLEWVIDLNKAPFRIRDEDGNTLLHNAVLCNRPCIAHWLLEMMYSVALFSMKNNAGYTPLEEAARHNSIPLVRILFESNPMLLGTWSNSPELRASYTSALAFAGEDLAIKLRLHFRTSQVETILGFEARRTKLDEAKVQAASFDWWADRGSIEWSQPERITKYLALLRTAESGEQEWVEWLMGEWGTDIVPPHTYQDNDLSIADMASLGPLGGGVIGRIVEALQQESEDHSLLRFKHMFFLRR
jgi:hypothetical protein